MSIQPNPPPPPSGSAASEAGSAPSLARRRLLRGGLAATPVLMVAAPRSVMAGTCMSGSLYTSFSPNTTMSRSPTTYTCSGKPPEWWRDCAPTDWPSTCVRDGSTAIKFKDVFTPNRYGEATFLQMLQMADTGGQNCMAKHAVAAILNANKYAMPQTVVGPTIVKQVWSDFCAFGYYEPTAGVRWGCDAAPNGTGGITPWLRSTMVG